jgi:hypothetical protein
MSSSKTHLVLVPRRPGSPRRIEYGPVLFIALCSISIAAGAFELARLIVQALLQ